MKDTRREFTEEDLRENYLIRDNNGCFLKHNKTETSWNIESGIEGAQLFSFEEMRETIDNNPDLILEYFQALELIDPNIYDLIQEA